jgi:hypothetical protein
MDPGDYIYIIIAIVLAIVNAIANKKKKDARQKARLTQQPIDQQAEAQPQPVDIFDEFIKRIEQEAPPVVTHEEEYEPLYQPISDEKEPGGKPFSIEYQQPVAQEVEEKLYPIAEPQPLDTPENVAFAPIDLPESHIETLAEYDYNLIESASEKEISMITDQDTAKAQEQEQSAFVEEFDARNAVLYTEVINPKYF